MSVMNGMVWPPPAPGTTREATPESWLDRELDLAMTVGENCAAKPYAYQYNSITQRWRFVRVQCHIKRAYGQDACPKHDPETLAEEIKRLADRIEELELRGDGRDGDDVGNV
jgi:hypothetical protein